MVGHAGEFLRQPAVVEQELVSNRLRNINRIVWHMQNDPWWVNGRFVDFLLGKSVALAVAQCQGQQGKIIAYAECASEENYLFF